eukprot:SAG11_NODE_837_length_6925_cov_43.745532_2_plen_40_part_00
MRRTRVIGAPLADGELGAHGALWQRRGSLARLITGEVDC